MRITDKAKYVFYDQGGPTEVLVNQLNYYQSPTFTQQWYPLGDFTFNAGTVSIKITGKHIKTFGRINADAMKLIPIPVEQP